MSQNSRDGFDMSDPMAFWRQLRDANLDAWAKGMTNVVNTDAFAAALGTQINTYLATSAPFQKFIEQYMEAYLARVNMPSRTEVVTLSQRLTNIEMRLDDLDARIDKVFSGMRDQTPVIVELLEEKMAQHAAGNGTSVENGSPAIEAQIKALDERTEQLLELVRDMHTPKPTPAPKGRRKSEPPVQIDVSATTPHDQAEDKALEGF